MGPRHPSRGVEETRSRVVEHLKMLQWVQGTVVSLAACCTVWSLWLLQWVHGTHAVVSAILPQMHR